MKSGDLGGTPDETQQLLDALRNNFQARPQPEPEPEPEPER